MWVTGVTGMRDRLGEGTTWLAQTIREVFVRVFWFVLLRRLKMKLLEIASLDSLRELRQNYLRE